MPGGGRDLAAARRAARTRGTPLQPRPQIIGYLEGLADNDPRFKQLEDASDGYIRDPDHNEVRAARSGFRVVRPHHRVIGVAGIAGAVWRITEGCRSQRNIEPIALVCYQRFRR
jgi:hypothetical protein